MLKLLIGIIVLILPFLLIDKYKEQKGGFFYVLSWVIGFQLCLSVILQALGVFRYNYVIIANFFFLGALVLIRKGENVKSAFVRIKNVKIDWILIISLAIVLISLYQVHNHYTGTVSTLGEGYKEVSAMSYKYPYFSDEWSAVSLIDYSLSSGKLPFVNPLIENSKFGNFEFVFHSFLSGIFMTLGLSPLTTYWVLALLFGLMLCLGVYFLLVYNDVSKPVAGISAIAVSLITNSANLPGMWYLLPLTVGLMCLLLGFVFISLRNVKFSVFLGFLTLLFYPPLFLLYTPAFLLFIYKSIMDKRDKVRYIIYYFGSVLAVFLALSIKLFLTSKSVSAVFSTIWSKFFYPTFTSNAIPSYAIWKVIPLIVILFSIWGIYTSFKSKKWIVVPVFIGLSFWVLYSFVLWRFLIEYQRVVFATSILLIVFAGFGLEDCIQRFKVFDSKTVKNILFVVIFVLLIFNSFSYTQSDKWQSLTLHSLNGQGMVKPAAPANAYLTESDLDVFKGITGKRFLSPPWKGLVIGVATKNYPLETKPSTITVSKVIYSSFMESNCTKKSEIALKNKIDYIYSPSFDCSGFIWVNKSSEGFVLYKVQKA